jgi:hypothetical protein
VTSAVAAPPSELVEFTRGGEFVAEHSLDPNFGGSFGLGFGMVKGKMTFAAVDDNTASREIGTLVAGATPRTNQLGPKSPGRWPGFDHNPGLDLYWVEVRSKMPTEHTF